MRQKDSALKRSRGTARPWQVKEAIHNLDGQGRVHEIVDRHQRMDEIARQYAARPESTLVVSPDNQSRTEINQRIHRATARARPRGNKEEHQCACSPRARS